MDDHAKNVLILCAPLYIILKQLILNLSVIDGKIVEIC